MSKSKDNKQEIITLDLPEEPGIVCNASSGNIEPKNKGGKPNK